MSAVGKRTTDRPAIAVAWCMAMVLSGCPWSGAARMPNLNAPDFDQPSDARSSSDSPPATGTSGAAIAPASFDRGALADAAWVHEVRPSSAARRQRSYRWRHAGIDRLLAQPGDCRPDLRAALGDTNPVVATNAAIALARLGDGAGTDRLTAAVGADGIKLPMRCAAAEALGILRQPSPLDRLRELTDRFGRDPRDNPDYLAEIHAELIHALVEQRAPAGDPRFAVALRSPSVEVRLEALGAWADQPKGPLPAAAVELRGDSDPRVRAAALGVLTRHRHPEAKGFLLDGLCDPEFQVRSAAIAELGRLPGGEGREPLRALLKDRSDLVRAQAVAALSADAAVEEELLAMAKDKSWRVRGAVADMVRRIPGRRGATVAVGLLDDPSPAVQQRVLAAIEPWDLAQSGPVLLEAMGKSVVRTRAVAARQLAARWAPAADFTADAAADRRAESLARLQRRFRDEVGSLALGAANEAAQAAQAADVAPVPIDRVEALLPGLDSPDPAVRQRAARELTAFGPAVIRPLEQIALGRSQPLSEAAYGEVLPAVSPAFAAIQRLNTANVHLRRRAASELVGLAGQRVLPLLALERLAQRVARESDSLVWESVLAAVADDPREPAARLAYTAIGHHASEVRRRACEHLAAHPDPNHLPVLRPALDDPSEVVVQAAARAIGAGGRLDDPRPLQRLLMALNEAIRLEAAIALARCGDPSGAAALERLAYVHDPALRRQVAVAMGELAEPAFASTLVHLLDDHQGVRRAALEALPKVAGHDVAGAEGIPPDDLVQRIELWKRWFRGETAAKR